MVRKPKQISGLGKGGASLDGQDVHFELLIEGEESQWLKFGHRALPQFLDALLSWAEAGRLRREQQPVPDKVGPTFTSIELGVTGVPPAFVLVLELSGSLRLRIPLDEPALDAMLRTLQEGRSRIHRTKSQMPN